MQMIAALLLLTAGVANQPDVLWTYPADVLPDVKLGANMEVALDQSVTSDGKGSLKVTYTGAGAAEAMLFVQPLANIDNAVLWYEADMKCEGPPGMAYAALWMVFGDGRYFSRGLDQRCTTEWQRSRIPFLLEKGQRPDRVELGIRFEGPGTVWVDNARLVRENKPSLPGQQVTSFVALFGLVFGIAGGVWGVLTGILASRGKAKCLILGYGAALCLFDMVFLGVGVWLWVTGGRQVVPVVITGAVVLVLMVWLLAVVARRYTQFEARRLAALDSSDSL